MVSYNRREHTTYHFVHIRPLKFFLAEQLNFYNIAINWQRKNRLGICWSVLIQKRLIAYDTVQVIVNQVLQCSIFRLIKQKQLL